MFTITKWIEYRKKMEKIPGVILPDGLFPHGDEPVDRYVQFYNFLELNRTTRFLRMNIQGDEALDIVKLFGVPLRALEKEFERAWQGYGPLASVATNFRRSSDGGIGGGRARRQRLWDAPTR